MRQIIDPDCLPRRLMKDVMMLRMRFALSFARSMGTLVRTGVNGGAL